MLIYCCRRANLLPLAVVKSTTPVPRPCDGPLTYPDSTTDSSLFCTALETQYVSLTSMRLSVRFDLGSSNTHGGYTRRNQVGVLCPRPWTENMGHSGPHGWGLASRPWYELRLQGMADGWVMGRDNGLLFWVSVEHRNILYVQPSQSGNRGTRKEGNERGPIQLRAWQKVNGMDWQRAVERTKGEGGRGVAGVGKQCALSWSTWRCWDDQVN